MVKEAQPYQVFKWVFQALKTYPNTTFIYKLILLIRYTYQGGNKMEKLEVTSMSSRGQVVIPQDIREHLGLKVGEKFVVVGEDDTVILKKITMPSFKNFDKLMQKTQQFAKDKGITPADVGGAVKRARK